MKFIYTILSLVFPLYAQCQTITEASLPKVNTENSYYTSLNTDLLEIIKTGSNQIWDISGVSGGIKTTTRYEDPANGEFGDLYPDATYFINDFSEVYYSSDINGVKVLGSPEESFFNPGTIDKGQILPPVFEIKTPMNMGDALNQTAYIYFNIPVSIIPDSILNTLPIKPDSLRLKVTTNYNYEVTGRGTLKCPGKDFNVLQQTADITTIGHAEAKVPFLGWIDVTSLVDFGLGQEESIQQITFWSPDHAGFVAQFQIRPDELLITEAKYTTEGTLLETKDLTIGNSKFEIYPNPSTNVIEINNLIGNLMYDRVQITSLEGDIMIDTNIKSGSSVNIQKLIPGTYIVNILNEGKVLAGKKLIKI